MFSQHLAALDAAVFAHLSDDTAAIWTRPSEFSVTLSAMLDRVERNGSSGGVMFLEMADVVRLSVAEAELRQPGVSPRPGDQFTVAGATVTVHGTPWRDEAQNGRDWLCLVSR